jgi:hypothetical protein
MTTYDFSKLLQDAKAGGAWPIGDYDFEVGDTMVKTSSSGSGNEMIVTKLRCLVGPYAGKSITNNFVLTADNASALNIFFRHMAAFGLDENFFAQIGQGDLTPIASALRGRRARITIGHRQWNGTNQNDIKAINPLTGGVASPTAAAPTGMMPPPPPGVQPPTMSTPPPPPPPSAIPATEMSATHATTPQQVPVMSTHTPVAAAPPPPAAVPPPAPPAATPPPPPPPPPVAAPAAAPMDTPPAGYTPEVWAVLPEVAKQAILATVQPVSAAPPPPPELPI